MAQLTLFIEIENFKQSPEFKWFESCMKLIDTLPNEHLTYESLIDGVLIHSLLCRMNIHIENDDEIEFPNGNKSMIRQNLKIIVNNIQNYYEHQMDYLIMRLPNIDRLVKDPTHNTDEAACLINLLIGCAQLCPEKEYFAESFEILQSSSDKIIHRSTFMTTKLAVYVFNRKMLMLDDHRLRESNAERIYDYVRHLHGERDTYKKLIRHALLTCDAINDDGDFEASLQDKCRALDTSIFNSSDSKISSELSQMKEREKEWINKIATLDDKLLFDSVDAHDLSTEISKLKVVNYNLDAKELEYYRDQTNTLSQTSLKTTKFENFNQNLMVKIEELVVYKNLVENLQDHLKSVTLKANNLVEVARMTNERNNELASENKELKTRLENTRKSESSILYSFETEDDDSKVESSSTATTDEGRGSADESRSVASKIQQEIQHLENISESLEENDSSSAENIADENNTRNSTLSRFRQFVEYFACFGLKSEARKARLERSKMLHESAKMHRLCAKVYQESCKARELLGRVQRAKAEYDSAIAKHVELTKKLEKLRVDIQRADPTPQERAYSCLMNRQNNLATLSNEMGRMKADLKKVTEERVRLVRGYRYLELQRRQLEKANKKWMQEFESSLEKLDELKKQDDQLDLQCASYCRAHLELVTEKMEIAEMNNELRYQNRREAEKWMADFQSFRNGCKALIRTKERFEQEIRDSLKRSAQRTASTEKRVGGIRDMVGRIIRRGTDLLLRVCLCGFGRDQSANLITARDESSDDTATENGYNATSDSDNNEVASWLLSNDERRIISVTEDFNQ